MERRAAVEYLLKIAELTDNSKFSTIVNDLARRVALSIDQDEVNLDKFCSKMAAELMFRDDYVSANKLMKIAEEAKTDPDDLLPLNEGKTEEPKTAPDVPDVPKTQQKSFIEENLPPPINSVMPPLDPNKLQKFIEDLTQAGADLKTQKEIMTINQDDSEKNQPQMEDSQTQKNPNL